MIVQFEPVLVDCFQFENCKYDLSPVLLKVNKKITCENQICIIYFLLASRITGLNSCFQFSNWTIKSCLILSWVRRKRWASQFFSTEKSEDPQNLSWKLPLIQIYNSFCTFAKYKLRWPINYNDYYSDVFAKQPCLFDFTDGTIV